MNDGISDKDLYQIINRALSQWTRSSDCAVNTEINIFAKKYSERIKTNPQMDMFEERVVLPQELRDAQRFLDDLEVYRLATDVDAEDNTIPENVCRRLITALTKYEDVITPENQVIKNVIIKNAWRGLPENQDAVLLEEYIAEAERIHREKPKKKQNTDDEERCAKFAYKFIKKVLEGDEIKKTKPCAQKIELYQKSIKLVDCLTPRRYYRTLKFGFKRDLNNEIYVCASALRDEYVNVAKEAKAESRKFDNAISNAMDYSIRRYGERENLK